MSQKRNAFIIGQPLRIVGSRPRETGITIGKDSTSVALVGCGRWGENILRDLRSLHCSVAVVARSDESVARAQNGGASVIVEAIAKLPSVAGVVVAVQTSRHTEVVDEVLQLGVPVFVEKPLCDDPDEARNLVALASGRLFVMDKWRYHPGVLELARIVKSEELGPVKSLHSRRVSWGTRHDDVDAVWVLAPHDLAIALEVLGTVPAAIHASHEMLNESRVGMIATLGGPPWVTIEVSSVAPAHRREIRLVCEAGVAHLDGSYVDYLRVARAEDVGAEGERRAIGTEMPLLTELRAFVGHLNGGPPPKSTAAEGAEVVRRIAELGKLAGESAIQSLRV